MNRAKNVGEILYKNISHKYCFVNKQTNKKKEKIFLITGSILDKNTKTLFFFRRGRMHIMYVGESKIICTIHLVVSLMTGPKPLPKRALRIVQSRASSFK
jgi:hypothetical protein